MGFLFELLICCRFFAFAIYHCHWVWCFGVLQPRKTFWTRGNHFADSFAPGTCSCRQSQNYAYIIRNSSSLILNSAFNNSEWESNSLNSHDKTDSSPIRTRKITAGGMQRRTILELCDSWKHKEVFPAWSGWKPLQGPSTKKGEDACINSSGGGFNFVSRIPFSSIAIL